MENDPIIPSPITPTPPSRSLVSGRIKKYLLVPAVLVLTISAVYYVSLITKAPSEPVVRPPIDPTSFTEEEALQDLRLLESQTTIDFSTVLHRKPVDQSLVPKELLTLVVPAEGESVTFEKDAQDAEYYYITYKAGLALPDNHLYLIRASGRGNFTFIKGVRDELASFFELASPEWEVRVSQLTISEERTQVLIYAKRK